MLHRVGLIGSCVALFITIGLAAQTEPVDDFRIWARTQAHPITIDDRETGFDDLGPVAMIIGSARVVAFGEPIHGSHEPLAIRNRLIRYLVTQQRFTAVALETWLSTSKRLYDYVLGNTTETDSAAATAFGYGFDTYEENRELLRWLRSYNATRPMSQRVAIYGIDLTGQGFPNAYRALEEVLAFLDHADPKLGIATRADFADVVVKFRVDRFTMLSQAEQNRISLKIDDLVALLALKRPQLTAATSSNNYEWALRHAINAKQDDDYLRLAPPGWQGWASEFPQKPNLLFESRFRDMLTMREVAMADNLRWVLERSGPQGRVVLFAHDNHVKMHELRLRSSEPDFSSWDGLQPAGVFARSELGNDLVVIGTYYGTAEGFETTNHVLPPNQHAMDGLLASLGLPTYLIDLRELPKLGPLADWFLCSHEVRDGLAGINLVRASEAYDAILYIDRLTPSRRPTDLQSSDR